MNRFRIISTPRARKLWKRGEQVYWSSELNSYAWIMNRKGDAELSPQLGYSEFLKWSQARG